MTSDGPNGARGPCLRIQAADDGGFRNVGEAEVMVAGVAPQPGESLGKVYARALCDHAFGLLDHHAASQGGGKLLVQALSLVAPDLCQRSGFIAAGACGR